MAASFLAVLLWMFFAAFGAMFFVQRFRYRARLRRGKGRLGFYPSAAALGNALHTLQITAVPQMEHVMQEKLDEPAEETELGEPDEETLVRRHILKQAHRIRRGEQTSQFSALWPGKFPVKPQTTPSPTKQRK